MSLNLVAISPMEGIGVIRDGHIFRLVRPPYVLRDCPELPEDSIRDAVTKYGFSVAERTLPNWDAVIDFLNQQAVESRRGYGLRIPDSIRGSEVIEAASVNVLEGFFDRVEHELIPQRLFDHAENLLLSFLSSRVLRCHPDLGNRAAILLARNKEARERVDAAISELANRDARFSSLQRHGQLERSAQIAKSIRERHSVFVPAG